MGLLRASKKLLPSSRESHKRPWLLAPFLLLACALVYWMDNSEQVRQRVDPSYIPLNNLLVAYASSAQKESVVLVHIRHEAWGQP